MLFSVQIKCRYANHSIEGKNWKMAISHRVDLYYQAEDGISQMPTTFRQAQFWLMEGYFAQTTKFKLMRADGTFGEWETLGDLISRNGKAMPFIEDDSSEEERKKRDEELQRLREEMNELNNRKKIVEQKLKGAEERHKLNKKELARLYNIAPVMRNRSIQTHMNFNGTSNGGAATSAAVTPEIKNLSIPAGVNPFALLRPCDEAKYKMPPDLAKSFKELRDLFERCDKKLLVRQTWHLFTISRKCSLCQLNIGSASILLEHVSCASHINAMQGIACADAYNFWLNAVRNASRSSSKNVAVKPGPSNSNQEPPKRSVQGAAPIDPPNLPVFSLLRPEKKVDKPCQNPKEELAKMKKLFSLCDKKKIDNDPNTLKFFENPMLCLICNRCAIDKVANLISHITGTGHMETVLSENHPVSQNAIDYWMDVIRRAK